MLVVELFWDARLNMCVRKPGARILWCNMPIRSDATLALLISSFTWFLLRRVTRCVISHGIYDIWIACNLQFHLHADIQPRGRNSGYLLWRHLIGIIISSHSGNLAYKTHYLAKWKKFRTAFVITGARLFIGTCGTYVHSNILHHILPTSLKLSAIGQCWFCTSLYMFCFAETGSWGEPVCLHLHSGPSNLDQPAVLGSHFLQRGPEPDPSPLSKHPRGESGHHCQVKGKTENKNKYHVANEKWGLGAFAQNEVLSCRKLWEELFLYFLTHFQNRHTFFWLF